MEKVVGASPIKPTMKICTKCEKKLKECYGKDAKLKKSYADGLQDGKKDLLISFQKVLELMIKDIENKPH